MKIFSNFVPKPSKLVTFDDSDPPWMNDFIKNKIKWKHEICKTFINNGCEDSDYVELQKAISIVSEVISRHKEEYQNHITLKWNDPMATAKTFWLFLKTFYNGKKAQIIPPPLINDKLFSDFEVKVSHFNNFFASQCTLLDNSSKIPENHTYITNTKFCSIKFENKDILNIIRPLSVGKAHDHIIFLSEC